MLVPLSILSVSDMILHCYLLHFCFIILTQFGEHQNQQIYTHEEKEASLSMEFILKLLLNKYCH